MAKKAKAKNGKKKGTAERVKPKSMAKFASARALFDHLSQTPREVKVNCTVHPIERDERRVMLTTDRGDWWAVHVTRIREAERVGQSGHSQAAARDISVTIETSPQEHDAMAPHLFVAGMGAVGAAQAPTIPPPPDCPGIARWVVDHWECL